MKRRPYPKRQMPQIGFKRETPFAVTARHHECRTAMLGKPKVSPDFSPAGIYPYRRAADRLDGTSVYRQMGSSHSNLERLPAPRSHRLLSLSKNVSSARLGGLGVGRRLACHYSRRAWHAPSRISTLSNHYIILDRHLSIAPDK